jgi:hypothetical protein
MLRKVSLRRTDLRIILRTERARALSFCDQFHAPSLDLNPPPIAESSKSAAEAEPAPQDPPPPEPQRPLLDPLANARPLDDSIARELFSSDEKHQPSDQSKNSINSEKNSF